MENLFGPYWSSYEEDLQRLNGLLNAKNSANPIPLGKVEESINQSAKSVMKSWEQLQMMHQSGKLELFQRWWKVRPAEKRRSWLRTFPAIRQRSDSALYLLANCGNCPGSKGEIQRAFLEPIIFQEDLLQGNVLSELLVARSSQDAHPRMLLSLDAKLVKLGYWTRIIPSLAVAGRVGFIAPSAPGDVSYGIRFESDLFEYPHWSDPMIARHQLEVQEKTYKLLVSLLSVELDEVPAALPIDTEAPSLLTQSMLQLHGKPDRIDWDLVESILKASMEESLDDLWRLRTDEQYWEVMFDEMGRNTERFLKLIFGRIDTFHLACEKLRAYNGTLDHASPQSNSRHNDIRNRVAVSMDATLTSIVNEKLAFLEQVSWTPPANMGATVEYLLKLIKKNGPQIRVMGCDTALRTLETSRTDFQDNVPAFIRLVFHDMSVIVSCMQETRKHAHALYNELEEASAYIGQSNCAAVEWDQRDRAWESLADTVLGALGNQVHQLNQMVGNSKRPVRDRHTDFWRYVDGRMPTSGRVNHIVRLIISNAAPVKHEAISEAVPLGWLSYSTPELDSICTRTQLKKSSNKSRRRSKKSKSSTLLPDLAAGPDMPPGSFGFRRPILILTEKKDQGLWADLSDGQIQVPWKDFNAFLGRLQFRKVASGGGGSGHVYTRTETDGTCRRIVFHRPHGKMKDQIEKSSCWAERLSTKYIFQVS
ncbi:hypothetical protein N7523_005561 [Penicillium sp. IBT 18751x]|nr:hypothetical protein N7523_005853 [Penicillium sp. IBT 18751x]KAJ6117810.1 hypothetical protein N7523_005561 [Penicillium sp. IBT 18751x]